MQKEPDAREQTGFSVMNVTHDSPSAGGDPSYDVQEDAWWWLDVD